MAAAAALPDQSAQDPHMAHTAAQQSSLDVPCNSARIDMETLAHGAIWAAKHGDDAVRTSLQVRWAMLP